MGEDGEPQVLEVNPRMSGSIIGSIAAGVNYPLEIVRMALGLPVAPQRCRAGVETLPPIGAAGRLTASAARLSRAPGE